MRAGGLDFGARHLSGAQVEAPQVGAQLPQQHVEAGVGHVHAPGQVEALQPGTRDGHVFAADPRVFGVEDLEAGSAHGEQLVEAVVRDVKPLHAQAEQTGK